jgi:hypothetical protein
METKQVEQLGLIGFIDDAIGKVFQPKTLANKDGEAVGTSVTMRARKDIAALLGINNDKAHRGTLDKAILAQSDQAFRKVKAELAGLGVDWTLSKVAQRTNANGIRQISIVCKEIKRNTGPTDAEIAKALGCSVEQVAEIRTRQEKALADAEASTLNVPASE